MSVEARNYIYRLAAELLDIGKRSGKYAFGRGNT